MVVSECELSPLTRQTLLRNELKVKEDKQISPSLSGRSLTYTIPDHMVFLFRKHPDTLLTAISYVKIIDTGSECYHINYEER
ncbi:hypothetical protein TNCT_154571 [Trichonephila clavata]|uniref:Uncharacterized protein n=1 Tax=Trichonephila clavata TaxID=2740835 RepID=A0A8X6JJ05_TRICU|nr:hypothetical protein TNCT_154571 [Trichonephila clavata]